MDKNAMRRPGLRDLSKPAPRGRMRGVLEATPPALTETCSGSADRPLPRSPLSGGRARTSIARATPLTAQPAYRPRAGHRLYDVHPL